MQGAPNQHIYRGEDSYAQWVESKIKDGQEIIDGLTPGKAHMIHMAMGMSQEANELSDAIKKWAIYNKPLDMNNVLEELGDLLFFSTALMTHFGITFAEVKNLNRVKLDKRYKAGYSDKEAQDRNDKQGEKDE